MRFYQLQRNNILRLGAFLAVGDVELDFLSIGQGAESIALDGAEVNEHIGPIFALNETEALALVKPFNGAGS